MEIIEASIVYIGDLETKGSISRLLYKFRKETLRFWIRTVALLQELRGLITKIFQNKN